MSSSWQRELCLGWEQPWARSVWGGLGAPGPPKPAGWAVTLQGRTFLEPGNGIIYRFSPSWIWYEFRSATLFSTVVCPSIQLTCGGWVCVQQMDLQCSAKGCSDRQWCNQSCMSKQLHEHSWKPLKPLCDESQLTPLLTPRKGNFTICNPKPTLFLIHGRLLALFSFPLLVNGWCRTTYRITLCPSLSLRSLLSHKHKSEMWVDPCLLLKHLMFL